MRKTIMRRLGVGILSVSAVLSLAACGGTTGDANPGTSTANLACDLDGFCAVCGVSGGPCCTGDTCNPRLTCYSASRAGNNTCQCGGPDTACCPGAGCVSGTACDAGTCRAVSCGGADQP